MMNTRKSLFILFFVLLFTFAFKSGAQTVLQQMYVKAVEENLRSAPNGKKVGALLEGTEATILVERDKWVKVQVTGWIWKESLSNIKPTITKGAYRALHILVKTRPEAEALLKQIQSGKDFAELAKTKSIAPSAPAGGDLGYFNEGDFGGNEIEQAILKIRVNELSGVIETSYGFNIFKRVK